MHLSADWTAALTGVFAVVFTVLQFVFRHWSKKQDKAIAEMQNAVGQLINSGADLRRYIRQLLFLLKQHQITYPEPPDSFYDTTIRPSFMKESNNE